MEKVEQLEQELKLSNQFHEIMGIISGDLIAAQKDNLDQVVNSMLERIGEALGVDRSFLFKFTQDKNFASNTHEWCSKGIEPYIDFLQDIPASFDPWWADRIFNNQIIHISNVDLMPTEAINVQTLLKSQEIKSNLNVPIFLNNQCWGFMGFDAVNFHRDWSEFHINYLKIISQLFSQAKSRIKLDSENRSILEKLAISKKMASLGIMSAGLAHEINNPLTIIQGVLHFLKGKSKSPENGELFKKVDNAIQRITNIVNDFKTISTQPIENEEKINCIESLEEVLSSEELKIIDKKISIELVKPSSAIWMKIDKKMFHRLITIVLDNAIDSHKVEGKVHVSISENDSLIILIIKDNGSGIHHKDLPFVFDAFYTTKTIGTGMGLGLYIAYQIMIFLEGSIEIDSSLGKGTVVTMTFPKPKKE